MLNVVSLGRHCCEIEHVVNELNTEILGLSELRLNEDIMNPEVGLEGFEIHCEDRDVNSGGVAIYVNTRISHQYSSKVLGHFAYFHSARNIHPPPPPKQCWL